MHTCIGTYLLLAIGACLLLSDDVPASDTELVECVAACESVSLLDHRRLIAVIYFVSTYRAHVLVQFTVG